MKTFVICFLAALSAAIGEALLSYAMKRSGQVDMGQLSHWLGLVMSVVRNSYIFLGVIFLSVYFFLYLIALSWADLSFVLPLTAVSYIFAAVLASVFLKEEVTWLRWIGTVVIIIGITLIALDGKQKSASPATEARGDSGAFSEGLKR